MIQLDPHPRLQLGAFVAVFPAALEALSTPGWLAALLEPGAESPLELPDDAVRAAVRDVLRYGGFKPTGRSKPASEYLRAAAADGRLGAINLAVDLGNAVSLRSGLPVSVVDLDRIEPPLRVGLAGPDARYVFNAAGQEIDVEGLVCLCDAQGPCANAVKDAQRTKTTGATTRTLSLVWGASALPGRVARTLEWYRALAERAGARVEEA